MAYPPAATTIDERAPVELAPEPPGREIGVLPLRHPAKSLTPRTQLEDGTERNDLRT